MLGFNKVFIMGNLTRDPELKYTPNGSAVASFGIATNRRWTTPEGERREEAEFHNMVVWGKAAETINQYVKKGNPLFVEGRLKTQSWEGPDGVKRQRTEVIVENFQFLGSGGGGSAQGGNFNNPNQAGSQNQATNQMRSPQDLGQNQTSPAVEPQTTPNDLPINNSTDTNLPTNDNPFGDSANTNNTNNPDDISIEDIPF